MKSPRSKADDWIITLIIIPLFAIATMTAKFWTELSKLDNVMVYALWVPSLVTLALGAYFFYLQHLSSAKMQKVINEVNKLMNEQAKIVERMDQVTRITAEMVNEARKPTEAAGEAGGK